MKVRFWGTRGSIPVSMTAQAVRAKLITALSGAGGVDLNSHEQVVAYVDQLDFATAGCFGGHSSCVQLETGGAEHIILDMGSGARPLAGHYLGQHGGKPQTYHVFMSHLHWDHIMGFPFFTPAYIPGNQLIIHSCHSEAEFAFRRQQAEPSFPVDFSLLRADIRFNIMEPGRDYTVAGLTVSAKKQRHGGDSYGWRFDDGKAVVVYTTDSEHDVGDLAERAAFADFFRQADLVIFDAMYSLAAAISVKEDWGHSSNIVGVELCQLAQAKRLCLFHHEPAYDDLQIAQILNETRRFEELTREGAPLEILSAWDGLEVVL
ncbi:MBL fold metallo-hydrolase [Chitinimonas sp. JJ19]|uniref:MBL fold metallo-hydrolase n=1 Tax=Chitinimonas sp. JJ19 TaxID=3109352 RepID=UPI001A6460F6|nr:MBL fold metallo-hydrolase [Chitinimonas sp.]